MLVFRMTEVGRSHRAPGEAKKQEEQLTFSTTGGSTPLVTWSLRERI